MRKPVISQSFKTFLKKWIFRFLKHEEWDSFEGKVTFPPAAVAQRVWAGLGGAGHASGSRRVVTQGMGRLVSSLLPAGVDFWGRT